MPSLPRPPKITVPIEVYYFDTDAGGVVHNVAYLRMVEVARTQLAETLGWPLAEMQSSGRVPVVARTEIDYLRPARLGDRLEIHASLHLMEKIRFILAFDLRRSSDNTLVARCTQTMVTVQLPSGRPQRVPAAWTDAYPELLAKQQTR